MLKIIFGLFFLVLWTILKASSIADQEIVKQHREYKKKHNLITKEDDYHT